MDSDNAEILLEVHSFIQTMAKDILEEPNNQQFQEMSYLLIEFFPKFLDHSENYFKDRFTEIIKEQVQAE